MTYIMQLLWSRRTSFCHSQGATSCPHCDPQSSKFRSVGRVSGRWDVMSRSASARCNRFSSRSFTNFLGVCMAQLPGFVEHDSLPPCSPSFGRTSAQGKLVSCLGHMLGKNRPDVRRNRIHWPLDGHISWRYYRYCTCMYLQ